jgi:hypothetical protein
VAAPRCSPYTSICCWFQAPSPIRTGLVSRHPVCSGLDSTSHLAALAIPETMGYTKIAGVPVIIGLISS